MTLKVSNPNDPIDEIAIRAMIYGQPGIGKTTLSQTAPDSILYDFDEGIQRVGKKYMGAYVESRQLRNWQNVLDFIDSPAAMQFKTHIFDTAGTLLDYLAEWMIRNNPKLAKSDGGLTMNGYGALKTHFTNFVKKLKSKGFNVIFIAHDKESKEGDDTIIRPDIVGGSLGIIMRVCDLVGYMMANGKKRIICFTPTDKFYAKNTCNLPDEIEIPNFENEGKKPFMAELFSKFMENINADGETNKEYDNLMSNFEELLSKTKDVKSANKCYDYIVNSTHIWGSKQIMKSNLSKLVKELGLVWDNNNTTFTKEKQDDTKSNTVAKQSVSQ